jgi:hypothetical protein
MGLMGKKFEEPFRKRVSNVKRALLLWERKTAVGLTELEIMRGSEERESRL